MDISQFVLFAGALFLLSIVLIAAGIILYRNQNKKESDRIAEKKKEVLAGPAQEPAPSTQPEVAAAAGDHVELLSVMRGPIKGQLKVSLMGHPAAPEAMSESQKAQLTTVLEELSNWLAQANDPSYDSVSQPTEQASAVDNEETEGSGLVPFAETLPDRVELRDVIPFRKKNIPKLEEAPPPPRSIAEQINDIVQEKLMRSPMAGRVVRLSEEPGGGLSIVVDSSVYQAIDEVQDAEVQSLIKNAVLEWNEKNRLNRGA